MWILTTIIYKNQLQRDTNVKCEVIKLSEEKVKENIFVVLKQAIKALILLNFIETKNLGSSKDTTERVKRQTPEL